MALCDAQVKGQRRRRTRTRPRKQVSPEYVPQPAAVRPRVCYALAMRAASSTNTPPAPELLLTLDGQASRPLSTPPTFPCPRSTGAAAAGGREQDGSGATHSGTSSAARQAPMSRAASSRQLRSVQERTARLAIAKQSHSRSSVQRTGDTWLSRTFLCCSTKSLSLYEEDGAQLAACPTAAPRARAQQRAIGADCRDRGSAVQQRTPSHVRMGCL
jgi:hypothetical protein